MDSNCLFNEFSLVLNASVDTRHIWHCARFAPRNDADLIERECSIVLYWNHKRATRIATATVLTASIKSSAQHMIIKLNIIFVESNFFVIPFAFFVCDDWYLSLHQNRWHFVLPVHINRSPSYGRMRPKIDQKLWIFSEWTENVKLVMKCLTCQKWVTIHEAAI